MEIRYWKQLERHPLSAEYDDIKGRAWTLYVENLREFEIVGDRKIIIHEGKVIDGWQLLRACIEAEIKPEFKELKLSKGMTAEKWVETVNDHRRHETQEKAMKRADERRERVAKARADGESIRTIAENEGVSIKTVQTDIEKIPEGVGGYTPETTKGKDGKEYPSTTKPLCQHCKHRRDVGKPLIENCEACAALRGDKKPPAKPKPGKPLFDEKAVTDTIGKLARMFDDRARVYGKCRELNECHEILDKLLTAYKRWKNK